MPKINTERVTAHIEDEFVVFLIGIRINAFWKIGKWLPVFLAMPKMLKELSIRDDGGLLGFRTRWGGRNIEVIQYWRSFEKLHTYARDRESNHLPAWADFNRQVADNGSVGIWHETYLVKAQQYESVYRNMPPYGLAAATKVAQALRRFKTASGRLGISDGSDSPVDEAGGVIVSKSASDDLNKPDGQA